MEKRFQFAASGEVFSVLPCVKCLVNFARRSKHSHLLALAAQFDIYLVQVHLPIETIIAIAIANIHRERFARQQQTNANMFECLNDK